MAGAIGRSGGARVGAGRPPKSRNQRWLDGNAGKRGQTPVKPAEVKPVGPLNPPASLTDKELLVWNANERLAREALTLTPATVGDFSVLCMLEVELAEVIVERRLEGWTTRGMFLAKEVRGLVQRLEAKRRAFRLAPMGKEMVVPEEPKDEWAEFEAKETVQ